MAELSLKQITDKLNTEFQGDTRKLVFWYDGSEDFINEIDNLELENAKVLRLEKDNQFYTKYFLEWEDKTTNYLIYAPFEKPEISENHLADTLRYSQEFFAEKSALICSDFNIPEQLRGVIQGYKKFFKGQARTQKFGELELTVTNRSDIEIGMMSVICKNKTASFEDVFRSVLTDSELDDNKLLAEFENYDLLEPFWQQVMVYYDYTDVDAKPTLEKLLMAMLVTYTSKIIDDVPTAWKPLVKGRAGNIMAFVDNFMNNTIYGERYDELSEIVYKDINGAQELEKVPVEKLLDLRLFKDVDRILINWLIGRLEADDLGATLKGMTIPEICKYRRQMHYGEEFRSEYFVIQNAYHIISSKVYTPISGIDNIVKMYTEKGYKIDRRYRYFYYYLDKLEDTTKFEKLHDLVENIYTNRYLNNIIDNWNVELDIAGGDISLDKQRHFYINNIDNAKNKTVVIISDALRYEVAATLAENLLMDEKCEATISAMQGVLPSYTPLGMSALLPYTTLNYDDNENVLVDGNECKMTIQREKQLQKYAPNSKAIQFDEVKSMKRDELRDVFTGQDVVYVYHNQVDARGDAAKTENEVFNACEEAIQEIHTLIRRLSSQANVHNFMVTADHGFIYKREKLKPSDKISVISNNALSVGKRYAISNAPFDNMGTFSQKLGTILGNDDNRYVSYPRATDIFNAPGAGLNYVHGGSSPQEMLVPLIKVKVEKGKTETTNATIEMVRIVHKITNLITSIDFLQKDPISDVVKETTYKLYFVSDTGDVISNENICVADKKDTDSSNRMFRFRFNFKNQQYSNMNKYYLVIYDEKNNIEVKRYDIIMDIAFGGDFGFF